MVDDVGHAGLPVDLGVDIDVDAVSPGVEVVDDGRGPNGSTPGGGHGLVGMRERVAVSGGSLQAGPGSTGGFRVLARLPYDREHVR